MVLYSTHSEASCCFVHAPPADLSSAGTVKHWEAAQRRHHEAAACTNVADRPEELTPALSGPDTDGVQGK